MGGKKKNVNSFFPGSIQDKADDIFSPANLIKNAHRISALAAPVAVQTFRFIALNAWTAAFGVGGSPLC